MLIRLMDTESIIFYDSSGIDHEERDETKLVLNRWGRGFFDSDRNVNVREMDFHPWVSGH